MDTPGPRPVNDSLDSAGIARLAAAIDAATRVAVMTGAGVSTESGLPDYRGPNGLWRNRRFEELASIDMFRAEPVEFWEFYRERLAVLAQASPNPAHIVLAQLQASGQIDTVITQNVDGLHTAAGASVLEVHGSLARAVCLACGNQTTRSDVESRAATSPDGVPRCDCGDVLKPDVVLFGEVLPPAFDDAVERVAHCDLLLICGTSLAVYPVAGLADLAAASGAQVAIINATATDRDGVADITIRGRAGEVLPAVARVLHTPAG